MEGQVEVVSDLRELMKAGILMPPAVKINDRVVVSGRVPKVPEVVKWLGEVAPKQV
ncbi:MAG: thioredoxin family protein [Syntrophobacteraceae bacterium]|nr:thioredoxin family protein [Syntrophobacteraceae bacterium]